MTHSTPQAYQGNYLKELLAKYDVPELEPYLKLNQRAVVKLERGEKGNSPLGYSRVGGYPDLPAHMEWPRTQDGTLMTSLAQLNLSQIVQEAGADHLPDFFPAQGMLYFFVGLDEPAYRIEHQVIYITEQEMQSLQYREPVEATILEIDADEPFQPYAIHAHGQVEFPGYGYMDSRQIDVADRYEEYYEELIVALDDQPEDTVGKMFGYPVGQHGDDEVEAATVIHTGRHTYDVSKLHQYLVNHFEGDEQQADQEVEDMLMLLELDSDDDIGYMWWDAGLIHFFIRKQDLLTLNFKRTYCSLYSS